MSSTSSVIPPVILGLPSFITVNYTQTTLGALAAFLNDNYQAVVNEDDENTAALWVSFTTKRDTRTRNRVARALDRNGAIKNVHDFTAALACFSASNSRHQQDGSCTATSAE